MLSPGYLVVNLPLLTAIEIELQYPIGCPPRFHRLLGWFSVMASSVGSRVIPVEVILWLSGGRSPVADRD